MIFGSRGGNCTHVKLAYETNAGANTWGIVSVAVLFYSSPLCDMFLGRKEGSDPSSAGSQPAILPLNYKRHVMLV